MITKEQADKVHIIFGEVYGKTLLDSINQTEDQRIERNKIFDNRLRSELGFTADDYNDYLRWYVENMEVS